MAKSDLMVDLDCSLESIDIIICDYVNILTEIKDEITYLLCKLKIGEYDFTLQNQLKFESDIEFLGGKLHHLYSAIITNNTDLEIHKDIQEGF